MPAPGPTNTPDMPDRPSALRPPVAPVARGFPSTAEATQAVLATISAQLGLRTTFLTRITPHDGRNRILAAHNEPGGSGYPGRGRSTARQDLSAASSSATPSKGRARSPTPGETPCAPPPRRRLAHRRQPPHQRPDRPRRWQRLRHPVCHLLHTNHRSH